MSAVPAPHCILLCGLGVGSRYAAPDEPAILNCDVVSRAEPYALDAAGAGVAGHKCPCFDKERIEDWISRAAHEAVVKVMTRRRE